MYIVAHLNPAQLHQQEHGEWLAAGLARHGLTLVCTEDVNREADVHIVSGPHYAKDRWQGHSRTVLLDRAYYHEERSGRWASMDWVSLGWLRADGSRHFEPGTGRTVPDIADRCADTGSIFLADYDGPIDSADTVRVHPARGDNGGEQLLDALHRHRTAIGYKTTALVTAALQGLDIVCRDPGHILNQPDWLELLPYADWHHSEIESGEAWAHLLSSLNRL